MTLAADAEANRAALVAQLYDQWGGFYMLRQLIDGAWADVRPLSRDEAMTLRTKANEALELHWRKNG